MQTGMISAKQLPHATAFETCVTRTTLRISLRNNVLRHSLLGAGTARPRGINLEYKFVYKMPGFPPAP